MQHRPAPTLDKDSSRDGPCPFCIVAAGGETPVNAQHDVVQYDESGNAIDATACRKGHPLDASMRTRNPDFMEYHCRPCSDAGEEDPYYRLRRPVSLYLR